MKPRTLAVAIAALLVAVTLAAPLRPVRAADLTGTLGGNLRVALLTAPSWDPLSTNPSEGTLHSLVWDTLARPDAVTGEPKPWAAESWTPNSTAKTITVVPRAGLTWSDGAAITLADLAATYGRFGFSVTVSSGKLVFDYPSGGAGRFYTEVLTAWIAWNSAGALKYSGMFAKANSTFLVANTHYWAGRTHVDSVTLVVATDILGNPSLDDAACRLLKKRVEFIGFPLLPNDLTDERACTAYGGWVDQNMNPLNKSLANANATRAEPHVSSVHHPGPKFLYYWLDVAGGGVLGDVNFRKALYYFVNKQLARQIEPSSEPTNSLINRHDKFWFLTSQEVKVDAGFTTIDSRQDTNPGPGVQALNSGGYIDQDGDGWRETPAGADFTLSIGVVDFSVDPRKTTIVGAYVEVLRRQGVNAATVTFPSWAALHAAEGAGTVDMALDIADTATANPMFLESFQPILDANDANTILHLGLGKNAYTLAERALHFNHVTFWNSQCACALPVLHYDTLEAFDRNAFSGWVDSFGGINSPWSYWAVLQPPLGALTVSIGSVSRTVVAGSTTGITVLAQDSTGTPIRNVTVDLSPSGNLNPTSGLTDANGRFTSTWTAPPVTQDTDATVTATVTKAQWAGAVVWTTLTARAAFRPLDVTVSVATNILGSGNQTDVTVRVMAANAVVSGADVTLTVSVPGGALTAYSGQTDTAGEFTTRFTARPSAQSLYGINAVASKAGYSSGSGTGSVIVSPPPNQDYTHITVPIPGFETVAVIAALGAAVAILRWRNRREG